MDAWNSAARPWMAGEAAMSWAASALAIAAARSGSGVLRRDGQERAVQRRVGADPLGQIRPSPRPGGAA